ncbi:MAG: ribonuclease D, partial [Planctomycetes bacterium]|nr:ribonuclease D [Planctomycetota bacterium]
MGDLLDDSAALAAAGDKAKAAGLLALDTEFVWTRTYWPRMGIVQLGTPGECWALDCLAPLDAAPLRALLADGQVTKILHDARQDLTHLRHWCGAAPASVFDTRLAAAFAGFPAGIGLQKLLAQTLGVELPKTETRTDWTIRPLSAAQVRYALDDVRYLPALRDDLLRRAGELGTRDWLAEDLRQYVAPALFADADPERAWERVKLPRGRLNRHGFAVLRAVAAAREEMARQWDLPRSWAGE